MIRTQIYLSSRQHDRLKAVAAKRHTTVSEVIREIVEDKFTAAASRRDATAETNAGEWLLKQADWSEKRQAQGPADLASQTDEYIYGGKK